jgi:UDP-N-acetylglucosamine--N-acetylmuramyl-(pentapeptide) pyrophosphoryl-undecaprenol N-acetylglucosamine transferase
MGLIRRFKPDALLMTGGWPALPATLAGWLRGIPIVIYQPDLEPGSTIKIVSRIARKIAANSPDSVHFFPEGKAVPCGYPLRSELVLLSEAGDKALARTHFGLDADRPVLLVFGGSKGTGALNNAVLDHLPGLLESAQVIHITGAEHWNKLQSVIDTYRGAAYHPYPYLHSDEMGLALAAADLVVSRAGASTLGEYPLFGLPAVLVPLARAWGYQETNADYLVKLGGAIRLDETRLADDFQDTITGLLADPKRLTAMGQAMRSLRRMDSAQAVLGVIYEAAG